MASGRLPGDFWPRAPGFVPPGAEPAPSAEEDSPFDTFVEQMYNEGFMDSPSDEPLPDKPLKKPASRNAKPASVSNAAPKARAKPSVKAKAKAKSAKSSKSSKPNAKPIAVSKPKAKCRAVKSKDSVDEKPSKAEANKDDVDVDAETLPVVSAKGAAKKASVLKKPSSSSKKHLKKPSKKTYPKPGTLGCSKCRYQGCSACLKPQDDDGNGEVKIDDEEEQMAGDV